MSRLRILLQVGVVFGGLAASAPAFAWADGELHDYRVCNVTLYPEAGDKGDSGFLFVHFSTPPGGNTAFCSGQIYHVYFCSKNATNMSACAGSRYHLTENQLNALYQNLNYALANAQYVNVGYEYYVHRGQYVMFKGR